MLEKKIVSFQLIPASTGESHGWSAVVLTDGGELFEVDVPYVSFGEKRYQQITKVPEAKVTYTDTTSRLDHVCTSKCATVPNHCPQGLP